jgi:transposase
VPAAVEAAQHLARRLKELAPARIVLVAPGGLEAELLGPLAAGALPLVGIHPRQAQDFARATGKLAKTDAIDAAVPAHSAEAVRPEPGALPEEDAHKLQALMRRRRQLVERRVAEQNRRASSRSLLVRKSLDAHILWLEERLGHLDKDLGQMLRKGPIRRQKGKLLRSVPGIGPLLSRTPVAQLPEPGRLSNQQLAALAGLAPLDRRTDSQQPPLDTQDSCSPPSPLSRPAGEGKDQRLQSLPPSPAERERGLG